jgi:hypothetical protein
MKPFTLNTDPKFKTGFTIPEGYFDSFSETVLKKLAKNEPRVVPFFSRKKIVYFAVAAVAIVLLSIPFYAKYAINNQKINSNTIEEYIAYNTGVSEEEIIDLLNKEDVSKIKIHFNIKDKEIEDELSNNANLEQYLLD